ncbi:MarR family winged helix-turn-helix transcriptional regulator [Nocardioides cynanchi]|uniref:MarR family winged helix-turn-helix transcriptional regulator n=1 Tax=Nocardioides cynanchi TaxID=2558918 RepID=UPI001245697C|nr:MarR family transcriptional regulator [Nocardioides cynanchi]
MPVSTRAAAPDSRIDITPLMLASRAVAAAMVRSLESVDASVSVTQMRVLVLLWTGEPLNLSAVAEGLSVNASNASRTCDRLVSAGFVDRGELTADRRQRVLTLTRKGWTFVEQLMERREQELAEIVARMSGTDRDALMAALTPFNEAATADLYPAGRPAASRDPRLHEWGI